MQVIVRKKDTFDTVQYNQVSNIAYDSSTKIVTITYGESQTATYSTVNYFLFIQTVM